MKVEVKKIDTLKRELKFEVPKDRVSEKLNEVYKDIGKAAKIKGFRHGKAPRHILEAHHGPMAQEETIKKLIPEVYQEGLSKENIRPIDLPEIQDVSFKDGILTFTAKLELKPEVTVKNYKGIKVVKKSFAVTEEELNKTMEYFAKGQGGDQKAAMDDAFAKGLGFPSLEEFKKSISRQMEMDKERHNRNDIENQIVDELIRHTKLTLPASLVKKQEEYRLEEIKKRMVSQGMSPEDIGKKEEEIKKDLKDVIERDIKTYMIFEKIAECEDITIKEGENMSGKVIEFLLKEAKWEEK